MNGLFARLSIPGYICTHCETVMGKSIVCPGCQWADPVTRHPSTPTDYRRPSMKRCGECIDPIDPRTGRPAQVWEHRYCRRPVKVEGERCWQHRPIPCVPPPCPPVETFTVSETFTVITPTTGDHQ